MAGSGPGGDGWGLAGGSCVRRLIYHSLPWLCRVDVRLKARGRVFLGASAREQAQGSGMDPREPQALRTVHPKISGSTLGRDSWPPGSPGLKTG